MIDFENSFFFDPDKPKEKKDSVFCTPRMKITENETDWDKQYEMYQQYDEEFDTYLADQFENCRFNPSYESDEESENENENENETQTQADNNEAEKKVIETVENG